MDDFRTFWLVDVSNDFAFVEMKNSVGLDFWKMDCVQIGLDIFLMLTYTY